MSVWPLLKSHRKVIAAALALSIAAALAASGSSSGSVGSSNGSASAGEFGTGLKLGSTVIHTAPVGISKAPWYRWNKGTCKFEVAHSHPAQYQANIRTIIGGNPQIGYMHYGNNDPFGIANSKSMAAMARLAKMPLDVYNLMFPSKTLPFEHARTAILKHDQGVVQANLDVSVLPAFWHILEGKGCIPSVQMYLPVAGHPAFGANWPDVGTAIGKYAATQAKARGWKPQDTAIVQCTDPDNGPTVNVMFRTSVQALSANGFALPSRNVFNLVCRLSEANAGQKRVTDWFTGHPNFKNLIVDSIDSPRMTSIIQALKRQGRAGKSNTLNIDSGLDPNDAHFIRAGLQSMSVAFFPERYGEWLIPMIQDIMAGNPVPSFVGNRLVNGTHANVNQLYPLKK